MLREVRCPGIVVGRSRSVFMTERKSRVVAFKLGYFRAMSDELSGPASRRRRPRPRLRHLILLASVIVGFGLAAVAVARIGPGKIAADLTGADPLLLTVGLVTMGLAMVFRAFCWQAILRAALPAHRFRTADVMRATFIGVLVSSALPARLGEPARTLVLARRSGDTSGTLPVIAGTVVAQTLLNVLALVLLALIVIFACGLFSDKPEVLIGIVAVPVVLVVAVLAAPALLGRGRRGRKLRDKLLRVLEAVRSGLAVFRSPRSGAAATLLQLMAWALQTVACFALLAAFGLAHRTGFAGAAAALFAVNVSAILPATPANVGVFQAACAAALGAGWHVPLAAAVAYGVVLQAVEIITAVVMGVPSLLHEGLSLRGIKHDLEPVAPDHSDRAQ